MCEEGTLKPQRGRQGEGGGGERKRRITSREEAPTVDTETKKSQQAHSTSLLLLLLATWSIPVKFAAGAGWATGQSRQEWGKSRPERDTTREKRMKESAYQEP